jgi:N-carbamoyl-L-amino-acid hydrolase
MTPQEAYSIQSTDGTQFGEELKRINYAGEFPCGVIHPLAYLELHIEQGPILDRTGITIGVVEAITGISWYKITIRGEANHVGTTPTSMRHDAGLAAAKIITQLREIANSLGENQRATCGSISFYPNTINVIPATVVMTVDMRNPDLLKLNEAEKQLENFLEICQQEDGVGISSYSLARVTPKDCDPEIIGLITKSAQELGYSQRPMISGAIHDALIMASYCPTGMIFIPSKKGISHNALEYTSPEDLEAGANVLLQATLKLASKNK